MTLPPALIKTKVEGQRLIQPLQVAVEDLTVTTPEEYATADELLSRIQQGLRAWGARMEAIIAPLRQAKQAADALNREVNRPLEQLEAHVKKAMRDYKVQETQELARIEAQNTKKSAALMKKIEDVATREATATAPSLKQRLADQRERLEQDAAALIEDAPEQAQGQHSTTRKILRWRVVNHQQAIMGLLSGAPDLIMLDGVGINRYFASDPDAVRRWPGFEIYEDTIIVGRR